jgi:hypothetical protein
MDALLLHKADECDEEHIVRIFIWSNKLHDDRNLRPQDGLYMGFHLTELDALSTELDLRILAANINYRTIWIVPHQVSRPIDSTIPALRAPSLCDKGRSRQEHLFRSHRISQISRPNHRLL